MPDLNIETNKYGVIFTAKIVPGSSKTAISGILDGMLKVKVSAPPEKGKANQCLIDFLAKQFDVKKKNISIINGETNPVKVIQVEGVSKEGLTEKLGSAK